MDVVCTTALHQAVVKGIGSGCLFCCRSLLLLVLFVSFVFVFFRKKGSERQADDVR